MGLRRRWARLCTRFLVPARGAQTLRSVHRRSQVLVRPSGTLLNGVQATADGAPAFPFSGAVFLTRGAVRPCAAGFSVRAKPWVWTSPLLPALRQTFRPAKPSSQLLNFS